MGVPAGPGLGGELDQAALAALHENYLACGLIACDDLVEIWKVFPEAEFRELH